MAGSISNIIDKDIETGYGIPSSLFEQQFIIFHWAYDDTYPIGGVLFHTNEALMTSGTVKFYVDDVECPNTNDVGVNAVGGVFNCNLNGNTFRA